MILNVLSVSLSMSIVILVLILMRKHINKKYSARVMCMIWLFVALRLLIPVEIDLPVSKVNLELNMDQIITEVDLPAIETPEFHNTIQLDQTIKVEEAVMPAANFSISWHDVVTCVWFAGAVFMLMKQVLAYCSISKWLKRNSVYEKTIDGFRVYLSSVLPEPLSFGTFKSSIYLTEQFKTDNWVLNHELMHCKHYDGLMMWIAAFVKSIHWFNPLVYYMDKQWEADRELYCDEAVLKDKTKSDRIEYMVTLYDAAEAMNEQKLRFANGLLDGDNQLVYRFRQITSNTNKRKGLLITLMLSVLIFMVSSIVGCTSTEKDIFRFLEKLLKNEKTKVCYVTNLYFDDEFYGFNGCTLAQYLPVFDHKNFTESQKKELEHRFNVDDINDQIQKDKEFMIEYDKKQRDEIISILNKMDFTETEVEKTKNLKFELSIEDYNSVEYTVRFYQGGVVTVNNSSLKNQIKYYKTDSLIRELAELTLKQRIWMQSSDSPYHKYSLNDNEEYRNYSFTTDMKMLERIGEIIE